MKVGVVQLSDLGRRGSWMPRDFLYETGERVVVVNREDGTFYNAIVVEQDGDVVRVSTVEHIPGSRTEFCCSAPFDVELWDISLSKERKR